MSWKLTACLKTLLKLLKFSQQLPMQESLNQGFAFINFSLGQWRDADSKCTFSGFPYQPLPMRQNQNVVLFAKNEFPDFPNHPPKSQICLILEVALDKRLELSTLYRLISSITTSTLSFIKLYSSCLSDKSDASKKIIRVNRVLIPFVIIAIRPRLI